MQIKPKPGAVMLFKLTGDSFDSEIVEEFKKGLQLGFPNNKVMVVVVPEGHDLQLTLASSPSYPASSCAEPTSYCNDCSCGKKERLEK